MSVPEYQELAKRAIISFVGCSRCFILQDLWSNNIPSIQWKFLDWTFSVSFMTDGFKPPLTEG